MSVKPHGANHTGYETLVVGKTLSHLPINFNNHTDAQNWINANARYASSDTITVLNNKSGGSTVITKA